MSSAAISTDASPSLRSLMSAARSRGSPRDVVGSSRPQRGPHRTRDRQTRPASAAQKETRRSAPRRETPLGTPPASVRAPPPSPRIGARLKRTPQPTHNGLAVSGVRCRGPPTSNWGQLAQDSLLTLSLKSPTMDMRVVMFLLISVTLVHGK